MALGEIAKLYATVGADVSGFNKGMKKVSDDLSFAEKGTKNLATAMGTGLKVAAGVGIAAIGALATGIGIATKSAADMEQRVADIRAVFGSTAPVVEELNKAIMDLGLDPKLKVSANEAADAIEMLAKNGVTWTEVMNGAARSTILLANATNDDFALAADVATDVMQQFNIDANEMGTAVDQIIGVTQQSKFSINDYALAIAQAGGVAGSVGVDFSDFNAVIAATSPSFASGSDAGTSFKVFLQRLAPQTDKAKEALSALGLMTDKGTSSFFDASGQMKSMSEIAGLLQGAFGNLSEAQKIEAASTIFGTDAMRTAFALADAGSETIDELKKVIGNTSAEEIAATRMDTLAGAFEIFRGIVETLSIGIGQKFLPVTRLVVEWASEMAGKYGPRVIEWAGKLADQMTAVVEVLIAVVSGGEMFQEKFDALPAPIKAVVTGVSDFIKMVKELLGPIAQAIGGFVNWKDAVIAFGILGLNALYPILAGIVVAMAPVLAQIAAMIAIVALLRKAWESDWGGIRTDVTNAWKYLSEVFRDAYDVIKRFGGDSLREIVAWASGQKTSFEATKQIWQAVKEAFSRMWDDMMSHLRKTNPEFAHQLGLIKESVGKAFQKAAEFLGVWRGDWDSTFKYITSSAFLFAFMEWIRDIPLRLQLMVKDAIRAFNNWRLGLEAKWQEMLQDAKYWWASLVNEVINKTIWWGGEMKKQFDAIYWTLHGIWVRIRNETMIIWQGIIDWILPKWNALINWWQPAEWIKKATDVVQGFWNGIKERWTAFTSWWSGKWEDLKSGFKNFFGIRSPSTVFEEFGQNIGEGLQVGLGESMQGVIDDMGLYMMGVINEGDTLNKWLDMMPEEIRGSLSKWGDAFVESGDAMNDWLSHLPTELQSHAVAFAQAGVNLGTSFGTGLTGGMKTAVDAAKIQLEALKQNLGNLTNVPTGGGGGTGGGNTSILPGLNLGAITDFLASRASDLYDSDALNQVNSNFKQATQALGNSIQRLDAAGMSDANLTKQLSAISKLLTGVAETGQINGSLWSEIDSTLKTELNYLATTIKAMRNSQMPAPTPLPTTTKPPTSGVDPHANDINDGHAGVTVGSQDISTSILQKTSAALFDAFDWITDFADEVQKSFGNSGMTSLGYNAIHALQALEPTASYAIGPDGQIKADYLYTKARTDTVVDAVYRLIEELKGSGRGNQFNVNLAGTQTGDVATNLQNAITYLYQLYG